MTPEEQKQYINTWVRNSAVDAFTNLRLNTILLALLASGVPGKYATSADFDAAIAANPDATIIGFLAQDDEYTGEEDVILMRIPGRGIAQIAADFLTDET